jgi:hypothetical protein
MTVLLERGRDRHHRLGNRPDPVPPGRRGVLSRRSAAPATGSGPQAAGAGGQAQRDDAVLTGTGIRAPPQRPIRHECPAWGLGAATPPETPISASCRSATPQTAPGASLLRPAVLRLRLNTPSGRRQPTSARTVRSHRWPGEDRYQAGIKLYAARISSDRRSARRRRHAEEPTTVVRPVGRSVSTGDTRPASRRPPYPTRPGTGKFP